MQKHPPRYRTDTVDGLPADIKAYLDERFLATLPHLDVPHAKLLVVFSGGNAMGKSTLSAKIGQELQALVLENDRIKKCLLELRPEQNREERNVLTWRYSMDLYARLGSITPNGLVVRDGLIDWYYDRILPVFDKQGYKLFIIGYDISREKREALVRKRGDTATVSADLLVSLMDEQDEHIRRFRQHYTPDILLTDDNLFDHERVINAIRVQCSRRA